MQQLRAWVRVRVGVRVRVRVGVGVGVAVRVGSVRDSRDAVGDDEGRGKDDDRCVDGRVALGALSQASPSLRG